MSKCSSCGAEITWGKTASEKSIPLDPESLNVHPDPQGDVVIITDDGRYIRGKSVGDANEDGYEVGRVSHFSTCPNADQHRRKA